jgi:hypothetical protein
METTKAIEFKVRRGTRVNIVEVDDLEGGTDASLTTEDDKRIKIHVKRVHGKPGISSRVVDIIMCG